MLSLLSIVCGCILCTSCKPTNEQVYLDEFRKGLDTIEHSFQIPDYEQTVRQFEKLHAIPLTKVPLNDEVRYWSYLYRTGFETEDFDVAIQSGIASLGLDWDEQDIRAIQPYIPMAHALKKARDTAKAIEWYNLALANVTETVRADVTSNLASLYVATGQYRIALEYTDESIRLNRVRGAIDPVAVAWTHVLKARSYGGLQMYDKAKAQLDSALEIFEDQKRGGEPYSQKDVRISLYQGLWTDSLNLRRIGPEWRRINQRLRQLFRRDSAELESIGVSKVRRKIRTYLHSLIPQYLSTSYQRVPDHLHPAMITSTLVDTRGWKWVGTLRGLCVDIGSAIVTVETRPDFDSRRPVRALSGDEKQLRLLRYDGTIDTIAWTNLIGSGNSSSSVSLPSVAFSWIPWASKAPTGVVSIQDTSQVMFFFGNRYGVASLRSVPNDLRAVHGARNAPWQGSVHCGLSLNRDTILLGTDRGLWILTPSTTQIHRIRLSPDYLNNADIRSLGQLANGSLRITILYLDPVVIDSIRISDSASMTSHQEKEPYLFEKTLAAANPIVTYLHGISASHLGDVKNRPAPIYSAPVPGLRVWMWDHTMYLHDAVERTFTLHTIPAFVPIDSAYAVASFGAADNMIGVADSRGLLLASVTRTRNGPSQRLVAYRTPSMTHFKISAEGAMVELAANERDLELVCGRPMSWGALSIRQSIALPWSGRIISSRTNRVEYINNVPVGEHDILIRTDDRYDPLRVHISAVPTLVETTLFRASVIIMFLGLLTGSIRYVVLARQSRRDAQERIRNTERLQIGQDVHDAVGADLVRISMAARARPSAENSNEIARLSLEASRTLRDIIWSVSETQNLDAAIAVTIERIRAMTEEAGFALTIETPSSIPPRALSPQTSRDLVLIITEAMTNVIKHSHAESVLYQVTVDDNRTTIVLKDDGIGFNVPTVSHGVGINSVRKRAQRSDLGVSIESSIDIGTAVIVTIPHRIS